MIVPATFQMLNSHLWLVTTGLDSADRIFPSWQKVPSHRAAREKVESSLFLPNACSMAEAVRTEENKPRSGLTASEVPELSP